MMEDGILTKDYSDKLVCKALNGRHAGLHEADV